MQQMKKAITIYGPHSPFAKKLLNAMASSIGNFIPYDWQILIKATRHVVTHLLACFAVVRTPSSIKTDNDPAYVSRQFKQFLQSFSIKHIIDIPYNPQAQDIVERTHHTLKLQIKKFEKREYTGILLSSLSRADFTRFQCNMFFKPITIVIVN